MKITKLLIFVTLFALIMGTSCKDKELEKQSVKVDESTKSVRVDESAESATPPQINPPIILDEKTIEPIEDPENPSNVESPYPETGYNSSMGLGGSIGGGGGPGGSSGGFRYRRAKSENHSEYYKKQYPSDSNSENTEKFSEYVINKFIKTEELSLSTFAIDVDTASYTIMRGKINAGQLPPPSSVRIEEYLNYFDYKYPAPSTGLFTVYSQIAENPFNSGETSLLRVALRAKDISNKERRTAHLTFMIDVSGSMDSSNKLPYVKQTLKTIVKNLRDDDTIAICTYSSQALKLLKPTPIDKKEDIYRVIDSLGSGGSTSGEAGLRNAYELAEKGFVKGHINRIIMCTDGEFNVGNTDGKSLAASVNHYARKGITFSAVGYGMGNY
ncbi:MAG: von Willebrand factor type A domain-containing protein, partial [Planctomycetes bacterium]|nr:von Willebrand factor type A domain-containing protein [Planctomycetota bacterium]